MTIDSRLLLHAGLVLGLWFSGMALAALAVDPQAVIVFGSRDVVLAAVAAEDGLFLSLGAGFVTARVPRTGTVRRRYGRGVFLVWPALRAGCWRWS